MFKVDQYLAKTLLEKSYEAEIYKMAYQGYKEVVTEALFRPGRFTVENASDLIECNIRIADAARTKEAIDYKLLLITIGQLALQNSE